jgi:hypothetical protein
MNTFQIQPAARYGRNRLLFAIMLVAMAGAVVNGQAVIQDLTTPPPVKVISSAEREQLNASKDVKSRVKLSIVLAEAHLVKAEAQTTERAYDSALGEAARYWAIIENAFAHLRSLPSPNNKYRDVYKKLELSLRAHGPRLSTIRRSMPAEYAVWLKEIEEHARSGRTEALNSFYGETVVRDTQALPGNTKPIENPVPGNSAAPRQKPL